MQKLDPPIHVAIRSGAQHKSPREITTLNFLSVFISHNFLF